MNFRNKLSQILYGRYLSYGIDLLTKLLATICIILAVINLFFYSVIIYFVESALMIFMLFRLFSKNIRKRQEENKNIEKLFSNIKSSFILQKRKHADRQTHIYKKCPHCSVTLRLPKKSGEHNVNCPRCKNNFKVKVR